MSTPINRPIAGETVLAEGTTSIASSPVAAQMVVPRAGTLERAFASTTGATTGTIAIAVAINGGSDVTNGGLTIPAGSGFVGSVYEFGMMDGPHVNEGDTITFTPAGGTGTNIGGAFTAVIR